MESAALIGVVDDPSGVNFYGYPSMSVNRNGAALIGYSVFNGSIFPSIGYSYIDPAGRLSVPAVAKSSTVEHRNLRWADFSTTVVDVTNDVDFWTVQTYSIGTAQWATWWSKIDIPPSPRGHAVRH